MRIEYDAESGCYLFQRVGHSNEKKHDWSFWTKKETVQWFTGHLEDMPKTCAECVFCRPYENYILKSLSNGNKNNTHYFCYAADSFSPAYPKRYDLIRWVNVKETRETSIAPHCPIVTRSNK
jgi:hypothetical protein